MDVTGITASVSPLLQKEETKLQLGLTKKTDQFVEQVKTVARKTTVSNPSCHFVDSSHFGMSKTMARISVRNLLRNV